MGRIASICAAGALAMLAACAPDAQDAAPNVAQDPVQTPPQDPQALIEHTRLATPADDTPVRTYTLADETRPILGSPAERTLRLPVPADQGPDFDFVLPPMVQRMPGTTLIATGVFQRGKRVERITPRRLKLAGTTATIRLPPDARGPGAAPVLTLSLTRPPTTPVVEERSASVVVPREATLHFAYALTDAAGAPGAGAVVLEVEGTRDDETKILWSTTVQPGTAAAHQWRDVTVPLATRADTHIAFTFRARAAGATPAILTPLWGDPTIVAPGTRIPERRNVILISLDTLRADRVGVYGSYRPTTPVLDALAAESAVLTNAWAPWPETSGSHMSLFTSRYPSEHGVKGFVSAPARTIELLAERLRRDGYLTRAFTEDGGVWANAGFARGFSAYGERRSPDFVYRGEAAGTFGDAIAWLEAHADRTFFLFVHTYEVHAPYAPPTDYEELFSEIPPREPGRLGTEALAYDRETRHVDHQVGRLLEALRRLDLDHRSIVIITSDHGEEFGEHGNRGHGRSLHREVLHIPMIVWAPGLIANARLATPASLLDIAPTVLALTGLAPDPTHRGQSLAPALRSGRSDAADDDRILFAEVDRLDRGQPYRHLAARRAGHTAILDLADESVRCYGSDDPGETRPGPDCADLVGALVTHRESAQPTTGVAPDALDPRLVEKMRALGYLE